MRSYVHRLTDTERELTRALIARAAKSRSAIEARAARRSRTHGSGGSTRPRSGRALSGAPVADSPAAPAAVRVHDDASGAAGVVDVAGTPRSEAHAESLAHGVGVAAPGQERRDSDPSRRRKRVLREGAGGGGAQVGARLVEGRAAQTARQRRRRTNSMDDGSGSSGEAAAVDDRRRSRSDAAYRDGGGADVAAAAVAAVALAARGVPDPPSGRMGARGSTAAEAARRSNRVRGVAALGARSGVFAASADADVAAVAAAAAAVRTPPMAGRTARDPPAATSVLGFVLPAAGADSGSSGVSSGGSGGEALSKKWERHAAARRRHPRGTSDQAALSLEALAAGALPTPRSAEWDGSPRGDAGVPSRGAADAAVMGAVAVWRSGHAASPLAGGAAPSLTPHSPRVAATLQSPRVACWQCGAPSTVGMFCAHCGARLSGAATPLVDAAWPGLGPSPRAAGAGAHDIYSSPPLSRASQIEEATAGAPHAGGTAPQPAVVAGSATDASSARGDDGAARGCSSDDGGVAHEAAELRVKWANAGDAGVPSVAPGSAVDGGGPAGRAVDNIAGTADVEVERYRDSLDGGAEITLDVASGDVIAVDGLAATERSDRVRAGHGDTVMEVAARSLEDLLAHAMASSGGLQVDRRSVGAGVARLRDASSDNTSTSASSEGDDGSTSEAFSPAAAFAADLPSLAESLSPEGSIVAAAPAAAAGRGTRTLRGQRAATRPAPLLVQSPPAGRGVVDYARQVVVPAALEGSPKAAPAMQRRQSEPVVGSRMGARAITTVPSTDAAASPIDARREAVLARVRGLSVVSTPSTLAESPLGSPLRSALSARHSRVASLGAIRQARGPQVDGGGEVALATVATPPRSTRVLLMTRPDYSDVGGGDAVPAAAAGGVALACGGVIAEPEPVRHGPFLPDGVDAVESGCFVAAAGAVAPAAIVEAPGVGGSSRAPDTRSEAVAAATSAPAAGTTTCFGVLTGTETTSASDVQVPHVDAALEATAVVHARHRPAKSAREARPHRSRSDTEAVAARPVSMRCDHLGSAGDIVRASGAPRVADAPALGGSIGRPPRRHRASLRAMQARWRAACWHCRDRYWSGAGPTEVRCVHCRTALRGRPLCCWSTLCCASRVCVVARVA